MGGTQSTEYAFFKKGTKQEGFSEELWNNMHKDGSDLVQSPEEGTNTVLDAFRKTVKRIPNHEYLGTRNPDVEGRPYEWMTWQEVSDYSENMSKGCVELGLVPETHGDGRTFKFMGIYGINRWEWYATSVSNMMNSCTTVAFYDTLGPEAIEFVMEQTGLTTISVQLKSVEGLIKLKETGKSHNVKNLIVWDKMDEAIKTRGEQAGLNMYHISEVVEAGKKATAAKLEDPKKDTIYMFCYTSGTTGNPKAAMLTHGNFLSVGTCINYSGSNFSESDTLISYLPAAHSMEQCLSVGAIIYGMRVGFWGGKQLELMEDLAVLKPSIFPSVPRIFNRIHDKIKATVAQKSGMVQWLFNRGVQSKIHYLHSGASYTHKFYDRLFASVRAQLGSNVRLMITGSAPISGDVLDFLKVTFGCEIREGYGQTETSAAATISLGTDGTAGHVGGPLGCIKMRLKDIPEMNYYSTDSPNPRGEVCYQGPSVFPGYYKADDKNAEAFEDGWLRSGDVAMVYPNGALKIVDRAKNIFKLSQGEYIAPEKLENVYITSPFLAQVYVHGDSLQSYLVGVAVVDVAHIKVWAKENAIEFGDNVDLKEFCLREDLNKAILTDLLRLATENKFNSLEKVKQIHLVELPLNEINPELLTPTMKIKRNVAKNHFQPEIEALYAKGI